MNRRAFLTRFGIGLSAAAVLSQIPESILRALPIEEAARRSATAFLLAEYRKIMKGCGVGTLDWKVSPGLYAAFYGELQSWERFVTEATWKDEHPHLLFKAGTLQADPALTEWHYRARLSVKEGFEKQFNYYDDGELKMIECVSPQTFDFWRNKTA